MPTYRWEVDYSAVRFPRERGTIGAGEMSSAAAAAHRKHAIPAGLRGDDRAARVQGCGTAAAARSRLRHLLNALLCGDAEAAGRVAQRALLETGSRTAVFADLLHPAQTEIGNLWYAGQASYVDEVRVAAGVRRIVRGLRPTPAARPAPRGSRCLLAVPRGDLHDIGVTMFALALQDHGWTTELLGPGSDLRDAVDAATARRPNLFCLSVACMPALTEVEGAVSAIRGARVPVLVGGAAFYRRPDLADRLGADALGTDVRMGVVLARRLGGR